MRTYQLCLPAPGKATATDLYWMDHKLPEGRRGRDGQLLMFWDTTVPRSMISVRDDQLEQHIEVEVDYCTEAEAKRGDVGIHSVKIQMHRTRQSWQAGMRIARIMAKATPRLMPLIDARDLRNVRDMHVPLHLPLNFDVG